MDKDLRAQRMDILKILTDLKNVFTFLGEIKLTNIKFYHCYARLEDVLNSENQQRFSVLILAEQKHSQERRLETIFHYIIRSLELKQDETKQIWCFYLTFLNIYTLYSLYLVEQFILNFNQLK